MTNGFVLRLITTLVVLPVQMEVPFQLTFWNFSAVEPLALLMLSVIVLMLSELAPQVSVRLSRSRRLTGRLNVGVPDTRQQLGSETVLFWPSEMPMQPFVSSISAEMR